MSGRHHFRKPDPLLLLVAAITLGVVMTTAVNAGEPVRLSQAFQQTKWLSDFDDNGYRVSRIGDTAAGVHVSMLPPPEAEEAVAANDGSQWDLKNLLDVYLTIRLPW
jgi:hypothetical protein